MANLLTKEAIAMSGTMDLDADGYSCFHNIGKEPYWSIQLVVAEGQSADGYAYIQGSNNKSDWVDLAWQGPDGYAADSIHVAPLTGANELLNTPGIALGFIRVRYERQSNDGTLQYWVNTSK
jgi:hypothetical protein